MNYFSKTEKKYNISKEYIDYCNFYSQKIKKKLIKKKEKCLDVLSTDEGEDEDSSDKISIRKEYLETKKEEEKMNLLNSVNEQNSIIISSNKPIKYLKNKKLNYVKSSKNISYLTKKFSTDKKSNLNFKKYKGQNISSINRKLNLLPKSNNNQKNNNEIYFFQNNNPNNSVKNFNENPKSNKKSNNIKSSKQVNDVKEAKFNQSNKIKNYYFIERNIKNRLPHIVSPRKRKEFYFQKFSLHNIENINIVPIILPNIENLKKVKNIRYESNKKKLSKKSSYKKK